MKSLEEKLNYTMNDKKLLKNSLTHSSYANENKYSGEKSNERLEFLGDSVLGMIVANYLYKEYPEKTEGELTRMRAELVCEQKLFQAAEKLELGKYLILGKGESRCGGRTRPSILADAMEAVIAAIFLDGGIRAARDIVMKFIVNSDRIQVKSDYKTMLQEQVQKENGKLISYVLLDQWGPDHDKNFKVSVCINGETVGTGIGHSKKEAEQNAAKEALLEMEK